MTATRRVVAASSPLILSVFCAIGALYVLGIITAGWSRNWDLSWAAAGLFVLALCCVVISGSLLAPGQTRKAKLKMIALCLLGSGLASGGVFYGLLANCRLSRTVKIIEQNSSPDGFHVAVHLLTGCEALVGYCPSVYQVRLIQAGENPTNSGTILFEYPEGTDYATVFWLSNQTLEVSCSSQNRLRLRDKQVGSVGVQFVTIGIL
jgi:hypothetical protein